jgi:hypothetical protein
LEVVLLGYAANILDELVLKAEAPLEYAGSNFLLHSDCKAESKVAYWDCKEENKVPVQEKMDYMVVMTGRF